ncbi:MAG: MFS transporter [Proteobacteria bacterium]|nr:MFS transporter [Pseudomonadota bacterium]
MPRTIWLLGLVSLLMDMSSEMIHSLLPVFLTVAMGASATTVGIIEGVAEATALLVKIFSGVISDRVGKRKFLVVLGYGLAACSKPFFALASSTGLVFAARFVDRIGKGIRGAPRDALIADIAPPAIRGAAFGLRQSLDTIGAFLGPLIAMGLMLWLADDFRTVFWIAAIPAFLALALLLFGLREPDAAPRPSKHAFPISRAALKRLPAVYWWVTGMGAMLTLARFSEAFLVLRAHQDGLSVALVPLVLVFMNVVYSALAYPFGKLADRLDRGLLLALGIVPLIAADLLLAHSNHLTWLAVSLLLWGVHLAATQGLLSAMVADAAPAELRGTAFGLFNLASGLAMLIASVVAGLLWDRVGAAATFYAGAGFAALALGLLLLKIRTRSAA